MDVLAGSFDFRTDEASAAAFGDEKAVAQYNALPNFQLPPFYGNSLEFAKWWQMFIYLEITFSPTSYETLKENMKDAFDDADAALRLLTDRLRSWPILKGNDYKHLAEFTGLPPIT